jgi:hypothetical protein
MSRLLLQLLRIARCATMNETVNRSADDLQLLFKDQVPEVDRALLQDIGLLLRRELPNEESRLQMIEEQ